MAATGRLGFTSTVITRKDLRPATPVSDAHLLGQARGRLPQRARTAYRRMQELDTHRASRQAPPG